jgi:hypothetical protein
MTLALLYKLYCTKVYNDLEKYVINELNFMSNIFISIYSGGGGVKSMRHSKGEGASYECLTTPALKKQFLGVDLFFTLATKETQEGRF